MIINSVKIVRTRDVSHYAWTRIGRFQNIEHTTSVIEKLHSLPVKHRSNARRQAEQIKYCLEQAREYYEAAKAVSLATRPVLLYYSTMSLALAEVLLKQDAGSRLSELRAKHNCHGLQLSMSSDPGIDDSLKQACEKLAAKPQVDSTGMPKGTFEVWRRSAREYPVGGDYKVNHSNGAGQQSYRMFLEPVDLPPPVLKPSGLSLFSCLVELPYMDEVLSSLGFPIQMVRASMMAAMHESSDDNDVLTVIIHPNADPMLIDKFGSLILVDPSAVNTLHITELPSGYIIKMPPESEGSIQKWPHAVCLTDDDIYFSCSEANLGEFGFLYAALHICGNFARYYPDMWLKHIEKNSPLAMAIEELCTHSFERLPLLTLSELVRTYHVLAK